jgi:hypothetical protein
MQRYNSFNHYSYRLLAILMVLGSFSPVTAQTDNSRTTTPSEIKPFDALALELLFRTGYPPNSYVYTENPGSYLFSTSNQTTTQPAVSNRLGTVLTTKPGAAFLGSALVPGLSQTAGRQYWKSALYLAAEVATIYLHIDGNRRGERLERNYINIGNSDWSVVKYAAWVHDYYHNTPGARPFGAPDIDIRSLLTPEGLAEYNRQGRFPQPAFSTDQDWRWIDINALRLLERRSLYLTSGRPFSHDLPDYGSQQYYELMSKYFQFAPGWRDYRNDIHNVNAGMAGMNPMWLNHTRLEERFNDSYRFAGNMLTLLVVNHVVSAFDAYFTVKLRNHRLESGMVLQPESVHYQLSVSF